MVIQLLNLFSLHGKYFRNDENRLTANLLFLLSELRSTAVPEFFRLVNVPYQGLDLAKMRVAFQSHVATASGIDVPDGELRLGDQVHLLIEAKIGHRHLTSSQLTKYARYLCQSDAVTKRMVCITQVDERARFDSIVASLEPEILPPGTCYYVRWYQLLESIKKSLGLSWQAMADTDRRILYGLEVDYRQRITTLFLKEVEQSMYYKRMMDEIPSGDLDDVVVTTQNSWFMKVAKHHKVWFPSGSLKYGLRPSKYVAYYETADGNNKNPQAISYLARNQIWWSRISVSDARQQRELKQLFADDDVAHTISSWYEDTGTFHLVLTEKPVKLRRPIPLGKNRKYAGVLSKRRYSLTDLMNAATIDDLF